LIDAERFRDRHAPDEQGARATAAIAIVRM
jgi:hypothetical protein